MRTPTTLIINHIQIDDLLFDLCAWRKPLSMFKIKSHAGKSFHFCPSFISRNARNRRQSHFRPKTMVKQDSFAVQILQNPNVIFVLAPEKARHWSTSPENLRRSDKVDWPENSESSREDCFYEWVWRADESLSSLAHFGAWQTVSLDFGLAALGISVGVKSQNFYKGHFVLFAGSLAST